MIKNKGTNRQYALIDINEKEIIDYTSVFEQERIDYHKKYPYEIPKRMDIMVNTLPLPDGSVFCKAYLGDWTMTSNTIIYWDSKNKEIKTRGLLYEEEQSGVRRIPMDTDILAVFENGYVIAGLIFMERCYQDKRPQKVYLLK